MAKDSYTDEDVRKYGSATSPGEYIKKRNAFVAGGGIDPVPPTPKVTPKTASTPTRLPGEAAIQQDPLYPRTQANMNPSLPMKGSGYYPGKGIVDLAKDTIEAPGVLLGRMSRSGSGTEASAAEGPIDHSGDINWGPGGTGDVSPFPSDYKGKTAAAPTATPAIPATKTTPAPGTEASVMARDKWDGVNRWEVLPGADAPLRDRTTISPIERDAQGNVTGGEVLPYQDGLASDLQRRAPGDHNVEALPGSGYDRGNVSQMVMPEAQQKEVQARRDAVLPAMESFDNYANKRNYLEGAHGPAQYAARQAKFAAFEKKFALPPGTLEKIEADKAAAEYSRAGVRERDANAGKTIAETGQIASGAKGTKDWAGKRADIAFKFYQDLMLNNPEKYGNNQQLAMEDAKKAANMFLSDEDQPTPEKDIYSGVPTVDNGTSMPVQKPPVAGARMAKDGKWYIPDPSRPGKYLVHNPQNG